MFKSIPNFRVAKIYINSVVLAVNSSFYFLGVAMKGKQQFLFTEDILDRDRFEEALTRLYEAIRTDSMLFKTVQIETHAPQRVFTPGSSAFKSRFLYEHRKRNHLSPGQGSFIEEEPAATFRVLDKDSQEFRLWLFLTTLTDRREKSWDVYYSHCLIYQDHPWLYQREVLKVSGEEIYEVLNEKVSHKNNKQLKMKYKIGSPRDSSKYWPQCARTIFEEFDGDPVNMFRHAGWSVRGVIDWKKKILKQCGYDPIPGFGPKLVSLYFLYLGELGFLPLPIDVFAADIQAQSIAYQVGALRFQGKESIGAPQLAERIRIIASDIVDRFGWDTLLLAHSTYFLGNRLCGVCYKTPDAKTQCPVYDMCSGRVDTSSYTSAGVWRKNARRMKRGGDVREFGVLHAVPFMREKRGRENPLVSQGHLFLKPL